MGRRKLIEITHILKRAAKEITIHWKDLLIISVIFFIVPLVIFNFLLGVLGKISMDMIMSLEFVSILLVLLFDMGLMASVKLIHERNQGNNYCWKSSNTFVLSMVWEIGLMSAAIWVIDFILLMIINDIGTILAYARPNFNENVITNIKLLVQSISLVYLSMSMKVLVTKDLGVVESIKYSIKTIKGRFLDASIKIFILFMVSYLIKGTFKVFAIVPVLELILTTFPKFYIELYKEIAKGVMLEQYNEKSKKLKANLTKV